VYRTSVRSIERVLDRRPLTKPEVENLRRSVGATGQLPRDQLDRLIEETARLLEERDKLVRLVAELSPPWGELRGALNEIHRLLNPDGQRPPRG
jgi:hypothetical protein